MSKLFVALIAGVTGIFAVGTVVAQENSKQNPITQQLTAMSLQVVELNARVETLASRRENGELEGNR